MGNLSRPPALLPPEDDVPPVLFRVTSFLTCGSLDLFSTRQEFAEVATLHLTAQRTTESNEAFRTCFVSATASFRYAVSIAEQHLWHSRKKNRPSIVAITVIDTSLLSNRGPIWDAQKLSNSLGIRLFGKQNSAKDEYIIFRQIGMGPAFLTLEYATLRESLRAFVPEVLDQLEYTKRRFSETWTDLPAKPNPDVIEAQAAFRLAEQLSAPSYRLRLPLMVQSLCLNNRINWGPAFVDSVLKLVSEELEFNNQMGMNALYTRICVTYQAAYRNDPQRDVPIFDFSNEYMGRGGKKATRTTELNYSNRCLAELGPYLQSRQTSIIKSLWNLSVVGVLVRKFTTRKGVPEVVDRAVKTQDREDWTTLKQLVHDDANISQLTDNYKILRQTIEGETPWPLARMYKLLKESRIEQGSPVSSWADMFYQLAQKFSGDRVNKRPLDSSEAEVPAAKKPRIILPLKLKQRSLVTTQASTPTSINHTVAPAVNPAVNPIMNVPHSLEIAVPSPLSHAPIVPTIHEPAAELKATTANGGGALNAHQAEPHHASDNTRAICMTTEQDTVRSTEAANASEQEIELTTSVHRSLLGDEPGTKVNSASTNVAPAADSDREVGPLEGYAPSDSTAVEISSEEGDPITSRIFLAGFESDRETKAPEVNASSDPAAVEMSLEEADVAASTSLLNISEPVAASEPEELKSVLEIKPILDAFHDHASAGHDDTSDNDEVSVIVSHRLANLAVPGAVIATPEDLEVIIEVLPLSSEEEENSS